MKKLTACLLLACAVYLRAGAQVQTGENVAVTNTDAGKVRGYAVDSQRTVAVRDLSKVCEHRLFLSATPHNGHSESFTALLEMIDNRRFSRGASVDTAALRDVTVRRLKRNQLRFGGDADIRTR